MARTPAVDPRTWLVLSRSDAARAKVQSAVEQLNSALGDVADALRHLEEVDDGVVDGPGAQE